MFFGPHMLQVVCFICGYKKKIIQTQLLRKILINALVDVIFHTLLTGIFLWNQDLKILP